MFIYSTSCAWGSILIKQCEKIRSTLTTFNKQIHFQIYIPIGLYLSIREFTAQLGPKYLMADFTWLLQSITSMPPFCISWKATNTFIKNSFKKYESIRHVFQPHLFYFCRYSLFLFLQPNYMQILWSSYGLHSFGSDLGGGGGIEIWSVSFDLLIYTILLSNKVLSFAP